MSLSEYPEVLTIEQAAEMLAVSKSTLYRSIRKEEIPHFRIGRSIRFVKSQILPFENENISPAPIDAHHTIC